jgi:hygromycin-B 7''-O-kinase
VPLPDVVATGHVPGRWVYVVLSRLPGVRWADRRDELSPLQCSALTTAVGRLLRRLHEVPGERFGALLAEGPSWPDAWRRVDARCDELVCRDLAAGGSTELTGRVRRLVDRHRSALATCGQPVLCHNDFISSNILVAPAGDPVVCGGRRPRTGVLGRPALRPGPDEAARQVPRPGVR